MRPSATLRLIREKQGIAVPSSIAKPQTVEAVLYSTYKNMLYRCFNTSCQAYQYYGGRGITVCERWLGNEGYTNFCQDMSKRPEGLTLERKDHNGNYSPDNCCWATWDEQALNRRPTSISKNLEPRNIAIITEAVDNPESAICEIANKLHIRSSIVARILRINHIKTNEPVIPRKPRRTGYTKQRGAKIQALYNSIAEYALANPYTTLREVEEATETTGWQVCTALREANIWKPKWPIGPKRTMWMKRERSARSEFFSGTTIEKDINQV